MVKPSREASTPPEQAAAVERPRDGKAKVTRLGLVGDSITFHLALAQESAFTAFVSHFMRESGQRFIRPGHFTLMTIIAENPGITQTVLSQAAARDKSTLTPVVREFVERGLVTRTPIASDRRSHALALTPKGLGLWHELKGHSIAVDEKLAQVVGPENRESFLRILKKIRAELHVPAILEDEGAL